ncbi:MAG TPA: malto-oligosyltrehalose synthase [Dermatophilaceae bacterium]|nr:malto-oligosyltrehalose synthase [Dermatophilaceae bacterium]
MTVTGTYRLQLHEGFRFADATRIVPYLARLGVSHLYLSPILQAAPGSRHGYDVIDHTRIADDLGGAADFDALAVRAGEHDLGLIVDVVPNHMAFVAPQFTNRPLWQVLKEGRDAPTATWFDIDWKSGGGRIGLPVLGDSLAEVLERGELVLGTLERDGVDEPVIRYHEHVFPVALGTETGGPSDPDTVRAVLDRQHYRLAPWRDKDDVLNYRRFFEVDQLIAVRVELPEVFEATHALLLDLNHRGLIDGFRIDHPDGLADPAGYLERLRQSARRGTHVWVEKILEADEALPTTWPCDGTTGYDALQAIQAALVDPAAAPALTRAWQQDGGDQTIEEAVDKAKRQVVEQSLGPEVERLNRRAREVLPGLEPDRLRQAIVEVLVAGEVYRAYVRPDHRLSDEAKQRLADAFARALASRPDLGPELHALLPVAATPQDSPAALDFSVRLQQTWGPVMAKGIEDTTFYRWHRLVALNEVGGDPPALESGSPQVLHDWAIRQQRDWPGGMTTLSTHDTKRSEDVRARILAVAGDPDSWSECSAVARLRAVELNIDAPTAHLIWQTLLGVGDIGSERLESYLVKAIREAKQHTAWVDGDPDYEAAVLSFANRVRQSGPLHDAVSAAAVRNAGPIRATILAAKSLALTLPGVPDVYQGCELVKLSLVDPDNRRPVDYGLRAQVLAAIDSPAPAGGLDTGPPPTAAMDLDEAKMLLTTRVLKLRRAHPELFGAGAGYAPLPTDSEHALGFVRTGPGGLLGAIGLGRPRQLVTVVTRAPARLGRSGGWTTQTVELPDGSWRDVLTERVFDGGQRRCAELFTDHPVTVLVRE